MKISLILTQFVALVIVFDIYCTQLVLMIQTYGQSLNETKWKWTLSKATSCLDGCMSQFSSDHIGMCLTDDFMSAHSLRCNSAYAIVWPIKWYATQFIIENHLIITRLLMMNIFFFTVELCSDSFHLTTLRSISSQFCRKPKEISWVSNLPQFIYTSNGHLQCKQFVCNIDFAFLTW